MSYKDWITLVLTFCVCFLISYKVLMPESYRDNNAFEQLLEKVIKIKTGVQVDISKKINKMLGKEKK